MKLMLAVTVEGKRELVAKSRIVRVLPARPGSLLMDPLPTRIVLDNGSVFAVEESLNALEAALND